MAETILTKPARAAAMSLANPYCVRYEVDGRMLARQGSMVAYRGELTLRIKSQGVRRFVKRALTGEGLALMEVEGRGEIWLADMAKNVFVVDGADLVVTGKSVLCFDAGLSYEIGLVKGAGMAGGGLFNCRFSGTGSIAVATHGEPFVIDVTPDAPVFIDTDAAIGWTAGLTAGIQRSEGLKSLLKGGSGELFQLRLEGTGSVIVQPSEGPPPGEKGKGVADKVGEFLA